VRGGGKCVENNVVPYVCNLNVNNVGDTLNYQVQISGSVHPLSSTHSPSRRKKQNFHTAKYCNRKSRISRNLFVVIFLALDNLQYASIPDSVCAYQIQLR
jgi:hypothetical protein